MKIAYIITTPLPSNKANVIQSVEMAKALCDSGAEVDFFCPKAVTHDSERKVINWLEQYFNFAMPFKINFSRQRTFKGRFGSILCLPGLLRKVILQGPYDFYYLRNCYLLYIMTLLGKPTVYEQHQWQSYADDLRSELVRKICIWGAKRKACKVFVCISEELRKRWIRRGIPESKSLTAHDGVDIDIFTPILSKRDARRVLKIPLDGIIVSYVGSLYSNRAINDIIEASRQLKNISFHFVGGPCSEIQKLQTFVEKNELHNVKFVGKVNRSLVPLHLFASDILLFTMNERTLTFDICSPMKIFEYMAAGRLIVAPDLPSIREVLRFPYAYLYKFRDPIDLVFKISEAIADTRTDEAGNNGLEGRLIVEKHFTWNIRVELILKVFRRCPSR